MRVSERVCVRCRGDAYRSVAHCAEGLQVVKGTLPPAAVDGPDVVHLPEVSLHRGADHHVQLWGGGRSPSSPPSSPPRCHHHHHHHLRHSHVVIIIILVTMSSSSSCCYHHHHHHHLRHHDVIIIIFVTIMS